MSFRYRPKSLLLRRTSSCSALPLNQRQKNKASQDWVLNDGTPPTCGLLNLKEEEDGDEDGDTLPPLKPSSLASKPTSASTSRLQVPIITLEPLRGDGVEHISCIDEPNMPCHFCREPTTEPVHENCTRLKIVSRGERQMMMMKKKTTVVMPYMANLDGNKLSPG